MYDYRQNISGKVHKESVNCEFLLAVLRDEEQRQ